MYLDVGIESIMNKADIRKSLSVHFILILNIKNENQTIKESKLKAYCLFVRYFVDKTIIFILFFILYE